MSAVMTASITKLCDADHRNDAATIASWTANKSIEGVGAMLADSEASLFIAEHDGVVAAVGSIAGNRIGLNYVHPEHRFRGLSRAMLAAMEEALRQRGVVEAALESTATAHRFYLDAGWLDTGEPQNLGRLTCYPMRKRL